MSAFDSSVDWLVVGGGIHGTYAARELLEAGVPRSELVVLDSHGELLAAFRKQARACGMETLRSNYVQHIGPSSFGLERFAEARYREDELVPTRHSQVRPTLDLFLDYADHVIDRFDLADLVRERTVTGIRREDALVVETTEKPVRAERVVLAIGPGNRYRRPDWADVAGVEHVWDDLRPPTERIDAGETVWVVGGGITAAQFATSIADHADVTLCTRHQLQTALREADPKWLNWQYIARELHSLPPGSAARYERLQEARNDGTIPSYLKTELEDSAVTVHRDEITDVFETDDGLLVSCARESGTTVDRIVLATGFRPVFDHPFVRQLGSSLSLARGYRGMPTLDDDTLAWQTQDGTDSNVIVTGKLAAGSVGAFAGNIPGARRAAERIVDRHPTRQLAEQVS